MQSIKMRSRVGEDGILHLDVPVGLTDTDLEVTVTVQAILPEKIGIGWPPGFFEETFGSFKNDPLIIDDEGVYDDCENGEKLT